MKEKYGARGNSTAAILMAIYERSGGRTDVGVDIRTPEFLDRVNALSAMDDEKFESERRRIIFEFKV